MSTLQERIAEIMETTGLTVGQLAVIAEVSSSAVSQWKDGPTKALKTGPATRLADRTGFLARWIADGDGPKKASFYMGGKATPVHPPPPNTEPGASGAATLEQALEVLALHLDAADPATRESAAHSLQTLARAPDSAKALASVLASLSAPADPMAGDSAVQRVVGA